MSKVIQHGEVNQAGDFVAFARVTGLNGENINQAAVSSIALTVTDTDADEATETDSQSVAITIFDTLQTDDDRWTVDTTGYNFRHTVPASAVPDGNKTYRAEFKLTMSDSSIVWVIFGVYANKVYAA